MHLAVAPLAVAPLLLAWPAAPAPAAASPVIAAARCRTTSDLLAHPPVARWRAAGGVTGASWDGTDGLGHSVRLTVAQAPTTRVRLVTAAVSGYGDVLRTTELTARTAGAVVGVNGDYFSYDWNGSAVPQGVLVRGGRVVRVPPGPSLAVGSDDAGRPVGGRVRVRGTVKLAGRVLAVGSVNDDAGSDRPDAVAAGTAVGVVTPWLGRDRPRRDWELVVRRGVVVASGRRPVLGTGEVLLAGSGATGRSLRAVRVGSRAAIAYAVVTDAGVRMREAVGSGSVMLRGGRDLATCDGGGDVSRPRTLIAWDTPRTRIWLVTVDGRGWEAPVSRYGLSYRQVTEIARALGAREAVMVDGGGSTAMGLRGANGVVRRVDAPASAPQREVPDGLVLVPR